MRDSHFVNTAVGAVYDHAQFIVAQPFIISYRNIVRGHRPRLQWGKNQLVFGGTRPRDWSVTPMNVPRQRMQQNSAGAVSTRSAEEDFGKGEEVHASMPSNLIRRSKSGISF